jgi:hypothetical protein
MRAPLRTGAIVAACSARLRAKGFDNGDLARRFEERLAAAEEERLRLVMDHERNRVSLESVVAERDALHEAVAVLRERCQQLEWHIRELTHGTG